MQTTFPKTRLAPTEIAPDTYLLHDHAGEGTSPVCVAVNTMLIRGAEPVVVDTGAAEHRDQFFSDLFSLVEPEDVQWVFISHDDVDHTGNVNELMAACPNATLVIDWFMAERMGGTLEVSPTRWRWLQGGDSFDAGDRSLHLVRPPIYDSPTTRGLFDPTTGVYWSSDAMGAPMPGVPVADVHELDADQWAEGVATFNQWVSPWVGLVDDARFQATVDRIEALAPRAIAGCHTPLTTRERLADALSITRRAPAIEFAPQPDEAVLAVIQETLGGVA